MDFPQPFIDRSISSSTNPPSLISFEDVPEEVNAAESVDIIGSLPDEILGHILSFLPTKTALSTSILSTRWRYLFPFSYNLDFNESSFVNPHRNNHRQDDRTGRFLDFVDRCIMLMNVTHVDEFRLRCGSVDTSRVNSWLCAAPLRNVRELDLWFTRSNEFRKQPLFVFTCKTLVVLKLGAYFSLSVPSSVYLPCLKSLSLHLIKFPDEISIQRLFSGCPLIEDLVIQSCSIYKIRLLNLSSPSLKRLTLDKRNVLLSFTLVLDAPSLVYLNYTMCNKERYLFKNLRSLSEVHISFSPCFCGGSVALSEFLEVIGSAKILIYDNFEDLHLLEWDGLPLLENLTRLVLTCYSFIKMSSVMKLLLCTPNLEEFVLDGGIWDTHVDGCIDVPSCVTSRLKVINYRTLFHNDGPCIEKDLESIEYLLKIANILEKMWIYVECKCFGEEVVEKLTVETIKKLGCTKACEVKFFRSLNGRYDDWVEF